jgi:hypothetical protein
VESRLLEYALLVLLLGFANLYVAVGDATSWARFRALRASRLLVSLTECHACLVTMASDSSPTLRRLPVQGPRWQFSSPRLALPRPPAVVPAQWPSPLIS